MGRGFHGNAPHRKIVRSVGISTVRYGLVINLLEIGRIKFEDYEIENIRPLVTSSPPPRGLSPDWGEKKVARLIGVTEIVLGALIGAKPIAPRASAPGSLAAVGMFATTLSFLATMPEAWQETRGEPKLSLAGAVSGEGRRSPRSPLADGRGRPASRRWRGLVGRTPP
ncbi:DUF417 family protein [Nonomuraea sp. NPDC003707]